MKRAAFFSERRGLSLPELLVVILVAGVAVIAASQLTTRMAARRASGQEEARLIRAQGALIGYLRTHLQLPESDGGWLPRELSDGLGGNRVRYFVSGDLVRAPLMRYDPAALNERGKGPNGLDVCLTLANLPPDHLVPLGQGTASQRVAVVLEYSSAGPTAGSPDEVALPGSALAAQRQQQGRWSLGVGTGELFAALNCPDRISRTAAAAKYQWAMRDMVLLAQANTTLKKYDRDVATAQERATELGLAQAIFVQALVTVDLTNYYLGFLGSLPKADPFSWLAVNTLLLGFEGLGAATIADLAKSVASWPATQQKLDKAIQLAQAQQARVEQALQDAKADHRKFQDLGLTK